MNLREQYKKETGMPILTQHGKIPTESYNKWLEAKCGAMKKDKKELEEKVRDTIFFLKSMITENLDCCTDSHKYNTPCLVCEAEELIEKLTKKEGN